MRKLFLSVCLVIAMVALVSCGSSNPAIKAGEKFLSNPSVETYEALQDIEDEDLTPEQMQEFEKWLLEHQQEISEAAIEMAEDIF